MPQLPSNESIPNPPRPNLLILPKGSGLSEADRKILMDCGYVTVEVEDPKNFVQGIPVAPITLSPDAITKALFFVVMNTTGARELFGRAIANFIHHGGFAESGVTGAKPNAR